MGAHSDEQPNTADPAVLGAVLGAVADRLQTGPHRDSSAAAQVYNAVNGVLEEMFGEPARELIREAFGAQDRRGQFLHLELDVDAAAAVIRAAGEAANSAVQATA